MDNFNVHNWRAAFKAKQPKELLKEEKESLKESPMYFDTPSMDTDFYLIEREDFDNFVNGIVYNLMEEKVISMNSPERAKKVRNAKSVISNALTDILENIKSNMYKSDFYKTCTFNKEKQ